MDVYREELLDHYHNPRNYGVLPTYTHNKSLENISCGDAIALYIRTKADTIEDIAFEGEGCAIAIASASMLTDHVKGKTINYINEFSLEKLLELLHVQLTPSRMKCALLSLETLKDALDLSVDPKQYS